MADLHDQRILILDFGGQTTQLIARRVRESGVYCEIHTWDIADSVVESFKPRGVILSGGPESVTVENSPTIPTSIFNLDVPILGICYGMQSMVHQLGGVVVAESAHAEFGYAKVNLQQSVTLFDGLQDSFQGGESQLDVWITKSNAVMEFNSTQRSLTLCKAATL